MAIRRPLCCFSFWTSGVGRVRTCPDESGRVGGRKKGTRSSLAAVPSSTNGRPRSFLFRPQGFVEGRRRCFFFGQTCRATILLRIKPGITGFYWFLLGYTGFYWVLTRFHWVLLGFTGFYWVLLGFTGFYWVLPSLTGFKWVLLGFTEYYLVLLLNWFLSSLI